MAVTDTTWAPSGQVLLSAVPAAAKVRVGNDGTLHPYVTAYLDGKRKRGEMAAATAIRSGYRLRRFADSFGRRPLTQLTRPAVERWLGDLEVGPNTRRLNLSTVRAFCGWLVYTGVISRDPTAGVRIRKIRAVPRALRGDDIARLIEVVDGDVRARAIIWLMVGMGLRCVEVSRLEVGDFDRAAATLFVRGKGGHERVLPVPEPVSDALVVLLRSCGATYGPVVRSRNDPNEPLTPGTISTLVSRWMRAAGIKHGRFDGTSAHALRHTAASDVLEHSGDLRAVQEMLGHADLNTTAVYLRRAGLDRLRAAMDGRDYRAGAQ